MSRIEHVIRDKLALELSILNQGLTLLDKEVYLKNIKGSRGFVDILASDSLNRYVLIELKRSDASSREALHEIMKYLEAIKENKSLKDDEIVLYVVSTEWRELIVPFSRFVQEVDFSIEGFQLTVDDQQNIISAEKILPLKLENTRKLSSECKLCLYVSESNREKGIKSFVDAFDKKEIKDFVLVLLHNDDVELMGDYQYMIYASVQEMSEEEYVYIIRKDQDLYEEYEEIINDKSDMSDTEHKSMLHGFAVDDAEPRVYFDYVEIGYPSKFNHKLLQDECWIVEQVLRYGRFAGNSLLTDETIINELKGDAGENKSRYQKNIKTENKSTFRVVKNELKNCLVDNPAWLRGINNALSEIEGESAYKNCKISIHNPMNTLRSIYGAYQEFDSLPCDEGLKLAQQWIPNYQLCVEDETFFVAYFGMLKDNGNRITLVEYFQKHYEGRSELYFLSFISTGYLKADAIEAKDIGFDYANYKVVYNKLTKLKESFYFDGYDYIEIKDITFNEDVIKFMLSEHDFIDDVNMAFSSRFINGSMINLSAE